MILTNYATGWLNFQLSKSREDLHKLEEEYKRTIYVTPSSFEEWVVEEMFLLRERIGWLSMVLSRPSWTHYAAALVLKAAQAIDPPAS